MDGSHLLSQGPSQLPVSTEGSHGHGDRMDGWMDGPPVAKFVQNAGLSRVSKPRSHFPLAAAGASAGSASQERGGFPEAGGGREVPSRWAGWGRGGSSPEEALQGPDVNKGRSEGWVLPDPPALPLPPPCSPHPSLPAGLLRMGRSVTRRLALQRGPGGSVSRRHCLMWKGLP